MDLQDDTKEKAFFGQATPESTGLASETIQNFLTKLADENISLHSMILVRGGNILAETYYAPYQSNDLQRMFSVTKTFTGLAIGFLAEEQKIFLDDPIAKYFPEKIPPAGLHPFVAQITIRNMLTMTTAYTRTTFSGQKDHWIDSYFTATPQHAPGTVFSYESSASCVLAAMVERLTGRSLLDYLRDKFLDQIGFSKNAYCLQTPDHYSHGASGLMCTARDLAKVGWLLLHDGAWQGRQYLTAGYVREAIRCQADTSVQGKTIEEQQGYGYQLWLTRHQGFVLYGLGGQLVLCLPKEDLMLITTADTQEYPEGTQHIYDAFWEEIYAHLQGQPLPEEPLALRQLEGFLKSRRLPCEQGFMTSSWQEKVQDQWYVFETNELGLTSLRLSFSDMDSREAGGSLEFILREKTFDIDFGLGALKGGILAAYQAPYQASAAWSADRQLLIKCRLTGEALGTITIQLVWTEQELTVLMKSFGEAANWQLTGSASGRGQSAANHVITKSKNMKEIP